MKHLPPSTVHSRTAERPAPDLTTPDEAAARAPAVPTLTLNLRGEAYLNREASRLLPADLRQLRLAQPLALNQRWWLLPGVAGIPVRSRADRLGYLRFRALELAAYAFAAHPPGTQRVYFELRPVSGFFQLYPLPAAQEPP